MVKSLLSSMMVLCLLSMSFLPFQTEGEVTYFPIRPNHEDRISLVYTPALEDNTTVVTLELSINNTTAKQIDLTKSYDNSTGSFIYDLGVRSPGTTLAYSIIAWNRTVDEGNISVSSVVDVLWHRDLVAAQALAKRLARPMLLFFRSLGEHESSDLLEGPFNDEQVLNLSASFVCVELDVGSDPDLYNQWAIDRTPTLVFLDNSSKEVDRVNGPLTTDKLLGHMRYALGLGPRPKEKVLGLFADPVRNLLIVTFLMLVLVAIVALRARSWSKRA